MTEDEWEKESRSQPLKHRVKKAGGGGSGGRLLGGEAGVAGKTGHAGSGFWAARPKKCFFLLLSLYFALAFASRCLCLSVSRSLYPERGLSPRELGKSSVSLSQKGGGTRPRSILIKQTYSISLLTPPGSTRLINYSTTLL